jgi:hypothetical protein
MGNSLTTELDATLKRLEIIATNTSDKDTKHLTNDCIAGIGQMTQQVKTILNLESETKAGK